MTELVLVKAEDCRALRTSVLHGGKSGRAAYPSDDDERTLHFAVKKGKKVLGVLSLVHDERDGLGSEVWRVVGAAVEEGVRRQGVGRQLLLAAQAVVERRGGGVWCEVPAEAVPFFTAFGFRPLGGSPGARGAASVTLGWRPEKR